MSDFSAPFTDMAERIERISPAEFAGAVVVVPPGGGEPIAFLTTDPKPDLMQFWSSAKSRIETAVTKTLEAAMTRDPWASR